MNPIQRCRWQEFDSRIALEQAAIRSILECAGRAIAERGAFHLVLAGGNTPRSVYRALRGADTDWSAWQVYFGDERCLPAEDPKCNSRMAFAAWLDHVAIPSRQIHRIAGELGPDAAAADYARKLAEVGEFDLVLLGLGEDGHTASLFPGGDWEQAAVMQAAIPVQDAPKPPPQRVSLSPERLSNALSVLCLVNGEDKREAVMAWRKGIAIPVSRIRPAAGLDVFLHLGGDIPPRGVNELLSA